MQGNIVHLQSLHQLLCNDEKVDGRTVEERQGLFLSTIEKRNAMVIEKAKQVKQIVELLLRVDEEIKTDMLGESHRATDPFDTVSKLFLEDSWRAQQQLQQLQQLQQQRQQQDLKSSWSELYYCYSSYCSTNYYLI